MRQNVAADEDIPELLQSLSRLIQIKDADECWRAVRLLKSLAAFEKAPVLEGISLCISNLEKCGHTLPAFPAADFLSYVEEQYWKYSKPSYLHLFLWDGPGSCLREYLRFLGVLTDCRADFDDPQLRFPADLNQAASIIYVRPRFGRALSYMYDVVYPSLAELPTEQIGDVVVRPCRDMDLCLGDLFSFQLDSQADLVISRVFNIGIVLQLVRAQTTEALAFVEFDKSGSQIFMTRGRDSLLIPEDCRKALEEYAQKYGLQMKQSEKILPKRKTFRH